MRKKRRAFSWKRLKSKFADFGHKAIECIKEYPDVKRETPTALVDIISAVCVLGISVVTIFFVLSTNVRPWP